MTFRSVARSITFGIFILSIISLLFSLNRLSEDAIENEVFGLVYDHASEESRDNFFSAMGEKCELSSQGRIITSIPNFEGLCNDFQSMPQREFFLRLISSSIKEEDELDKSALSMLKKTNDIVNSKIIIISLILLFGALSLILSEDTRGFFTNLGRHLLRIGLFILIVYLVIVSYVYFIEVDTSQVFVGLTDSNAAIVTPGLFLKIMPLLFLKLFDVWILVSAASFVVIGMIIKSKQID